MYTCTHTCSHTYMIVQMQECIYHMHIAGYFRGVLILVMKSRKFPPTNFPTHMVCARARLNRHENQNHENYFQVTSQAFHDNLHPLWYICYVLLCNYSCAHAQSSFVLTHNGALFVFLYMRVLICCIQFVYSLSKSFLFVKSYVETIV